MEDLLSAITAALPWIDPERQDDIVQDIAILVLEGKIDFDSLGDGIRRHLPELKRKYPLAQFQISLDAPINNEEGTSLTFGDVIQPSTIRPKRRKPIGRPVVRTTHKTNCEQCGNLFYFRWKKRTLKKKELKRAAFLPRINPKFYSKEDVSIMQALKPRRFCSGMCVMTWAAKVRWDREFANAGRKRYDDAEVVRLYIGERHSTVEIARLINTDPRTVGRMLSRRGVTLRQGSEAKRKTCIEPECKRAALKVRHTNNGTFYGTRCRLHRRLHRAELGKWQTRKVRNIHPSRWRYKDGQKEHCFPAPDNWPERGKIELILAQQTA